MDSGNKLFLLDAYALIYRAYYAFIKNPRINSKGFNTSAILGFVNTLEEVLKKENPTHIGVAFDPSGPTFRHEAFEQYKAQREETPEAIRLSVPIIKDIIHAYRIPVLEVSGYEADDVIGTLATEAGRQGITTYMMTPDKDYGQLVSDKVFMYRPKHTGGFEVMGVEEVKAKFDIKSPAQVIDMLGLMGDSSDNIPGCPGIGEKTAQKLIAEFGSIENLLEHTDQLKGALKTKVETNREMITFSKFLATIKIDVPIQLEMDALVREEADENSLRSIFEELEFRTLIDRVLKKDISGNGITSATGSKVATGKSAPSPLPLFPEEGGGMQGDLFANFTPDEPGEAKKSNLETLESLTYSYQLIDTEEKRQEIIQKLLTSKILSLDTETTGTEPMDAELVGMSFSIAENEAFYVPVPSDQDEALKIVNEFRPVFENENSLKVGQNIKYDMIVLQNYGATVKGPLFDTMIAHYVLQPELRHGMDYLAEIYLHYQTIHIDELIGPKGKNQKNMRDLDPKDVYLYACEDADVTLKLKNVLEKELKENDAERLFYDIEMPLVPVLVNIERNGVLLDTEALKQSSAHFTAQMEQIEKEIYELAGETFNIASPKQVGEVLFDKLKIVEKAKKTKTGQYVTSEEVLESLRHKHPVVEKMISNDMFICNDTYLNDKKDRISIITGPNMAGKSTYMRQTALIVLMAQIGSFVPASSANIGVVDRIFTRVGASDDLASGQSTFMVEMTEVANILHNATKDSLIILDEIGRGTSTFDGLSIAWSVVEHIVNKKKIGAKTLFATHYHELTELEGKLEGVQNYCIAVKEDGEDIVFLRKIVKGGADRSYGIQVARLAGVPDEVLVRAREIADLLEAKDANSNLSKLTDLSEKDLKGGTEAMTQLSIFDTMETTNQTDAILFELRDINLSNVTPMDAMNLVYKWQNKLKEQW